MELCLFAESTIYLTCLYVVFNHPQEDPSIDHPVEILKEWQFSPLRTIVDRLKQIHLL